MIRIALSLVACIAVTATNASIALAQMPPDTFRLSELVVTATRLPLPLNAVPAAVTVIDGDALRSAGIRLVSDALRRVPGLHVVQSGSTGGLTSVFIRGGESDYVRVLVDGVAVNDPGGAVDVAHLTTDDVERIEVVRGPTSVLYGSDAATGVIQVFTRRGGTARITASLGVGRSKRVGPLAAGSSPSLQAGAGVTGAMGVVDYGLSVARHATEGAYAFNNDYDNTTVGGRIGLAGERTTAQFTARYVDGTFHFPTDGGGAILDANQFRRSESLTVGIQAGQALSDRVLANVSVTARNGDYRLDDGQDGPADTLGGYALEVTDELTRRAADVWFDVRPTAAVTVTVGATTEWQAARSRTLSESSFGPFESESDNDRRNRAFYTQVIAQAATGLTLTAGGRVDDNDRFGTFGTYRAGLAWAPATDVTLRASAGTGFKEPTFFENFASGFVSGNPSLQPERTRSFEFGVQKGVLNDRLVLGATAFTQRFRNLIQFTFEPPEGTSNYFNVGAAESSGLELSARWLSPSGLSALAGWDILHTEVTDEGFGADRSFLSGQPLLRRPRQKATFLLGYATTGLNLSLAFDRTGSREDLDFSDPTEFNGIRTTLNAYTTVGLAAELTVLRHRESGGIDLVARLDNVFDVRYEETRNFPASGRALFLGIRSRIDP